MEQLWINYGKNIAIIFYIVALLGQFGAILLIFDDTKSKIVMMIVQFVLTTAFIYGGYKIANRVLGS